MVVSDSVIHGVTGVESYSFCGISRFVLFMYGKMIIETNQKNSILE